MKWVAPAPIFASAHRLPRRRARRRGRGNDESRTGNDPRRKRKNATTDFIRRGVFVVGGSVPGLLCLCALLQVADGKPLDRLKIPVSENRAIQIALQLCEILAYLHNQSPPIIHRDIKPQNVILDKNDHVHLIDFGISRQYTENAVKDTALVATQGFAPPEQYGFKQTDCRTDIYSLGVLLCFLLTGQLDLDHLVSLENRRLAQVIRKCAEFAPKDRYPTADAVKRALLGTMTVPKKRVGLLAAFFAVLAVIIPLVVWQARMPDVWPAGTDGIHGINEDAANELPLPPKTEPEESFANAGIVFIEPLIEQAVRASLKLDDHAELTEEQLASVRLVAICGDRVFAEDDLETPGGFYETCGEWFAGNSGWTADIPPITRLDDLAMLPALHELHIDFQQVTSLEPLAGLTSLNCLTLSHNPIEDIAPLAKLKSLEYLNFHHAPFTDLSPLSELPLRELGLSNYNDVLDIRPLSGLRDVEYLNLCLNGLMGQRDFMPDSPVKTFIATGCNVDSIDLLSPYKDSLQTLRLSWTIIKSLEGIEEFTRLEELQIMYTDITDFTPLLALPELREVWIDATMLGAAAAVMDSAEFDFIIEGIRFTEPLIEQAVRAKLGLSDSEEITASHLLSVDELYIRYDKTYDNAYMIIMKLPTTPAIMLTG